MISLPLSIYMRWTFRRSFHGSYMPSRGFHGKPHQVPRNVVPMAPSRKMNFLFNSSLNTELTSVQAGQAVPVTARFPLRRSKAKQGQASHKEATRRQAEFLPLYKVSFRDGTSRWSAMTWSWSSVLDRVTVFSVTFRSLQRFWLWVRLRMCFPG